MGKVWPVDGSRAKFTASMICAANIHGSQLRAQETTSFGNSKVWLMAVPEQWL